MNTIQKVDGARECHELVFKSLSSDDHTCVFPCDALGHVDMDHLSERARCTYLYARVVVRNSLEMPVVRELRNERLS